MKKTTLFGVLFASTAALATSAQATTLDFSTFANGTILTNQVAGLTFSVSGGPATTGGPLLAYPFGDANVGLTNGTFDGSKGDYPTFSTVAVDFAGGASGVSFTFENYGVNTFSPSTYSAFNAANVLIGTGDISTVGGYSLVSVAGSGIYRLEINNGSDGSYSWLYGVGALNYSLGAVPEPASWALMIGGFGVVGGAMRRRRSVSVTYA